MAVWDSWTLKNISLKNFKGLFLQLFKSPLSKRYNDVPMKYSPIIIIQVEYKETFSKFIIGVATRFIIHMFHVTTKNFINSNRVKTIGYMHCAFGLLSHTDLSTNKRD